MSVDASKRTILWISDSCNGHPCRAIVFVPLIEIRSLPQIALRGSVEWPREQSSLDRPREGDGCSRRVGRAVASEIDFANGSS